MTHRDRLYSFTRSQFISSRTSWSFARSVNSRFVAVLASTNRVAMACIVFSLLLLLSGLLKRPSALSSTADAETYIQRLSTNVRATPAFHRTRIARAAIPITGVGLNGLTSNPLIAAVTNNSSVSYGLAAGLHTVNNSGIDDRVAKLTTLGARAASSVIDWNTIEPTQGNLNWSNPDYWVNKLIQNQIEPIAVLLFAPPWANGNSDPLSVPYNTTNQLANGGFEDPALSNWSQHSGDGTVGEETSNVHGGTRAVELTSGLLLNTYITQTVDTVANTGYSLRYWAANDAERYEIVDKVHNAQIVPLSSGGNWGPSYQLKAVSFRTPPGCTQIQVYFWGPAVSGHTVYIDDAQVLEMTGPTFEAWKTAYVNFVKLAAARYVGQIHKYEVWNEANLDYFWKPVPDVQQYIELYSATRSAIHEIDPTAEVSVQIGALQGSSDDPRGDTFLQAFYSAGVIPDVASYHAYTYNMTNPPTVTNAYNNFSDIAAIRSVMTANNAAANKMWITEFGWPTDKVTPVQQAAYLGTALEMIQQQYSSYVTVALIYQLVDAGDYFGLFTSSGLPKPSAVTVGSFFEGQK